MRRAARAAALALALATTSTAPAARAFCRSTTCSGDCPVDEHGCKTTGVPLAWPGMCVGISLQEDASRHMPLETARPAIVAAFSQWSRRPCDEGTASVAFMDMPDVSCHQIEYVEGGPNANVIMFQDDKWTYGGAENTLGRTTVTYDAETGEILDADLEINHALNELTVSDEHVVFDLQSIVTHEAGHLLGLDHSTEVETIMGATYQASSIADRTLQADDVHAICAAYPPDRQARCESEPEGGFTSVCADEVGSLGCAASPARPRGAGAGLGALAALLLAAARRRRQRQVRTTQPSTA